VVANEKVKAMLQRTTYNERNERNEKTEENEENEAEIVAAVIVGSS
jgi:hypothetical protein